MWETTANKIQEQRIRQTVRTKVSKRIGVPVPWAARFPHTSIPTSQRSTLIGLVRLCLEPKGFSGPRASIVARIDRREMSK